MKYKQNKKKQQQKRIKNIALLLHNFLHQKVMFRHFFGSRASVHIAVAWEDQRFHSNSLHFSHSYLRFYY